MLIDVDHLVVRRGVHLEKRFDEADSGVVEDPVERAEFLDRELDGGFDLFPVGHVDA